METIKRCRWCNPANARYVAYHDNEWGVLRTDDAYLYELLLLETFQAGLSWECVLNKRDAFREAFDGFAVDSVVAYDEHKIQALLRDERLIRNERKIRAVVRNSRIFQAIVEEYGSFFGYLKTFVTDIPLYETDRTTSPLSDAISRDLKARGMCFVGSVTVYAYLQAIGIVYSHDRECRLFHGDQTPATV